MTEMTDNLTFYLKDGMTAIHLSAKYGHVNILEALKGHVSWRITSKKVNNIIPFYLNLFIVEIYIIHKDNSM